MSPSDDHDHNDLHDRGLQFDLQTLIQRRHALKLLAGGVTGGAALVLIGCGDDDDDATETAATGTSTAFATTAAASETTATATVSPVPTTETPASACNAPLPEETAGPFPGDGSNGPNVLSESEIVRSDIRSSFGSSTTQAQGVPLMMELTVVDTGNDCEPLAGAAVYAWHCDREGGYSMYSPGVVNENYLRGVQAADDDGVVTFQSIFPGAYSGRWPHVHFEVYPSLNQATSSANKLATSQLAFPEDACNAVYVTPGYEQSITNMTRTTLDNDGIFRDGYDLQLATVTGSVENGYTAELVVGV